MNSISSTIGFLKQSLAAAASAESMDWLELQVAKIKADKGSMKLFLSFSQASRHFSKHPMDLPIETLQKAEAIRNGFSLNNWTGLQTARVILVLEAFSEDHEKWFEDMEKLFESADIHEQEALYAALPIYPIQEKFTKRAAEGLRSNMTSVFDAIALNNPYPADYFSEQAWNQMVLKAIFMQRPLYRIVGIEQRQNVNLATTLVDYIHERWSAGRNVIPELWRFLSPFVDEEIVGLLEKVGKKGDELEKYAAALACHESDNLAAKELLTKQPQIKEKIENGVINWEKIGKDSGALN
ncbi:EboA domain-containing protein [uncultured Cyclobacterium sp.]|uniref:EboA domain-containing protein n=1 Tax=uncultured Cyclobacterium sp. TaxID=453820 RepID=UPI0030EEAE6E